MRLGAYLSAPRPAWDWQRLDCCRWVDGWVQARGYGSPIAALGLVYDSERSALRRIAEGGGLAALWARGMVLVGCAEAGELEAGDVGVIRRATTCETDEAAGIWTGERWATLGLAGLEFGQADVVEAWRV